LSSLVLFGGERVFRPEKLKKRRKIDIGRERCLGFLTKKKFDRTKTEYKCIACSAKHFALETSSLYCHVEGLPPTPYERA